MIYRTSSAHEEGGERVFAVNTECFLGDADGSVRALRAHEVEQKFVDGRMSFEKVEGSDFELPCDLVLLAMGFLGPEQAILKDLKLETDPRSNIKAEHEKYRTNLPNIFAAGDCRRGQSLVVWAINEGRGAARECDRFLMGSTDLP